ncbi:MAG: tight adherence protein [Frankiales bacterium]|nr:tight adherence protein [Frankiales bacterium]
MSRDRTLRLILAAPLIIGLLLLQMPGVRAATGTIDSSVTRDGHLQLLFSAHGLSAGKGVDVKGVTATVNGLPVPATASTSGLKLLSQRRATILLVDTSGSMQGAGIIGARQAAAAFLRDVPADVRVGLATFSDAVRVLVAPTTDHGAVLARLSGLRAKGNTRLYDALTSAVHELSGVEDRRILLLSDGADTGSQQSLQSVSATLAAERVRLDAVAFRTGVTVTATLQGLASASGGDVTQAASAGDLAKAFSRAAATYTHELLVTVALPSNLAGSVAAVVVQVHSSAGVLSATTRVSVPGVVPAPSTLRPTPSSKPLPAAASSAQAAPVTSAATPGPAAKAGLPRAVLLAGMGIGVGLALLFFMAFDTGVVTAARRRRLAQISRFSLVSAGPGTAAEAESRESPIARSAAELAGRMVARRDPDQKLRLRLDRAGIAIHPNEWVLLSAGTGLAGALVLALLTQSLLAALLLGLPLGVLLPQLIAGIKARRRMNAFMAALPDALQLAAGSLSTGYSLPQALDSIVRQGTEPIAGEIGRALTQARLGVPVEDALDEVATRMGSEDFRWVVMAIRVQREVGGNLSEVLSTVAHTLRERERLRRHVRALSAEGRLSAYILVALPVGIFSFLFLFRRPYIRPLYTESAGIVMLGAAGLLIVSGSLWMRSLIKIEV